MDALVSESTPWTQTEFEQLELGDARLNKRARLSMERPDEIRSAYPLTKVRRPAQPKLNEVSRLIARLRGFLGSKGDGEPGAKTIWLGLREVHIAAKTLRLLRDDDGDDSCV